MLQSTLKYQHGNIYYGILKLGSKLDLGTELNFIFLLEMGLVPYGERERVIRHLIKNEMFFKRCVAIKIAVFFFGPAN